MNRDHNRPSTSAKAPADSPRHEPVHEPLLDAMHLLEAALSSPAPGREETWRERVAAELATLRNVLATHVASTESRKGMFVDVESTEPALHHRIERL
ncbi:MAG TPA: hypothetical protein VHB99_02930, partial [Pirellulales bacterium]|nr:hypothetical protein [Pirellulales bacterium]